MKVLRIYTSGAALRRQIKVDGVFLSWLSEKFQVTGSKGLLRIGN
jgi:hypothetical protein